MQRARASAQEDDGDKHGIPAGGDFLLDKYNQKADDNDGFQEFQGAEDDSVSDNDLEAGCYQQLGNDLNSDDDNSSENEGNGEPK